MQIKWFKTFWENWKSSPLQGRNLIVASICPQLFGLYIVKLAVALVLAGGQAVCLICKLSLQNLLYLLSQLNSCL